MKEITIEDVFRNVHLIALNDDYNVLQEGKPPKAPYWTSKDNPDDYVGINDYKYPTGVPCGYIDKLGLYLTVIDIDNHGNKGDIPISVFKDSIEDVKDKTYVVKTGTGGYHIYLLSKEAPQMKGKCSNIDYKKNGYVVANWVYDEESNKLPYQCISSPDIPLKVLNNSDDVLKDLLDKLEDMGYLTQDKDKYLKEIIDILSPYFKDGQRSDMTLAVSGYLKKKGFKLENVLKVIKILVKNDIDFDKHIQTVEDTFSKSKPDNVVGYDLLKEYMLPNHLKRLEGVLSKNLSSYKEKVLQAVSMGRNPNKKDLANYILSENELFRNNSSHSYYVRTKKGIFKQIDEEYLISFINREIGSNVINRKLISSVLNEITETIEIDYDLIVFNNGVLNTRNMEFKNKDIVMEKAPKMYIPYDWNPSANGGEVENFLMRTFDDEDRKDNYSNLLRMCGHLFQGTNSLGKILFIYGKPATGKSTFMFLLKLIFDGNYSNNKLEIIAGNERFRNYDLINKAVNFDDEASNVYIKNDNILKSVITGEELRIELKGENKPVVLGNEQIPKLVVCGNELPIIKSEAFQRRAIIIYADNVIPIEDRSDKFRRDLAEGKHREGFEWFIYTAINEYYTNMNNPIQTAETEAQMFMEYQNIANPLDMIVEDVFAESYDDYDYLSKKDVSRFIKMAGKFLIDEGIIDKRHFKSTSTKIKNAMERAGYDTERRMIDGDRTEYYVDIKLTDKWVEIFKETDEMQSSLFNLQSINHRC